jgi:hypothetical protein
VFLRFAVSAKLHVQLLWRFKVNSFHHHIHVLVALVQDAGSAAKSSVGSKSSQKYTMQVVDGYFRDDRWINGTWDFAQFPGKEGKTDWDAVIDAEMQRRKMLEDSPIPSRNDDPVNFDTSMIPWWAWVKRFHLPEAEKLNGRAAMVGYLLAGLTELASGAGLVEQQVRTAHTAPVELRAPPQRFESTSSKTFESTL